MKMLVWRLAGVLMILNWAFSKEYSNKWERLNTDYTYGTPMAVEEGPISAAQCLAKCSATTECECVNVHRDARKCELSAVHPHDSLSRDQRLGWTVYCKSACPAPWLSFQGSCYMIGTAKVNFTTAIAECEKNGTHLVQIDDQAESTFIKTHLPSEVNKFWIGLTDKTANGSPANVTRLWTWVINNTLASFFDWSPSDPTALDEKCVVISKAGWHDVGCSRTYQPVCKQVNNITNA